MYSDLFCKVYNEFGWNYFPEAFGEQLLQWMKEAGFSPASALDLGCGTGVLCEILTAAGIKARGMDLSEGMIKVARQRNAAIPYDVGDMTVYLPPEPVDLVTSTGDALNHIERPEDVAKIFACVSSYLNPGGYFVFDILRPEEIPSGEPFDLPFDETVRAVLQVFSTGKGTRLNVKVFENDVFTFEENIYEYLHAPEAVCAMLEKAGLEVVRCSGHLLENMESSTCYIIARKP